jgi:sulfur-oxidizing protein SoxY
MNPAKTELKGNMNTARRGFLGLCARLLPFVFLRPVFAREREPSTVPSVLDEAIASELGRSAVIEPSDQLALIVPDIAEDGAIVPITIETALSDVKSILLFVEKNPIPLTARFNFRVDMQAYVSLHIKMNDSSDIIAIAEMANGTAYSTKKWVKVLQGGCG